MKRPEFNSNVILLAAALLKSSGFVAGATEDRAPFWRRIVGEGISLAVSLEFRPGRDGSPCFDTFLFVQSRFVALLLREVSNTLGWSRAPDSSFRQSQTVVFTSLSWLTMNGDPPKRVGCWRIEDKAEGPSLEQWWADFILYGGAFVSRMNTPQSLARWTRDLSDYPHVTPVGLRPQFDAGQFAALLTYYAGRADDARQMLADEVQRVQEQGANGTLRPEAVEQRVSENAMIAKYLNGEIAP